MEKTRESKVHEFSLLITGGEGREWQGILRSDDGTPFPFCSAVELLNSIRSVVGSPENPEWEKEREKA